jgi:hypothetical protein
MTVKRHTQRLYNLIFPFWLVWLVPMTWFVVLPANLLIDFLVVWLMLRGLRVGQAGRQARSVVWRVWGFGFLSDLIGTALLLPSMLLEFDTQTPFGNWWYYHVTSPVAYNPLENPIAFVWVALAVAAAGVCIYFFNRRIAFRDTDLTPRQKHVTALSLAVFTAPYLFLLPMEWFY